MAVAAARMVPQAAVRGPLVATGLGVAGDRLDASEPGPR